MRYQRAIPTLTKKQIDRFWKKVDRVGDGCWNWKGASDLTYGIVRISKVNYRSRRVAYSVSIGLIPLGASVESRCGNGLCCNPDHLILDINKPQICSISGCGREIKSFGLCASHYSRRYSESNLPDSAPLTMHHRGHLKGKWNGGKMIRQGRVLIYAPDGYAGRITSGSYVLRSRLMMEDHIGRFLTKNEHVHHKNGIKSDDRLENLEIMSPGEHSRLHLKFKKRGKNGRLVPGGTFNPNQILTSNPADESSTDPVEAKQ